MLWKVKYHPFLLERFDDFFTQFCWGSKSAEGGPYPLGHRHDNGAIRIQEQMDLEMTFNYFIKRNDLTAKESWQIRCHI